MKPKIYISADHRGVGLKLYLIEMLYAAGYENVVNMGVDVPEPMVDYPEIAHRVTDELLNDKSARGIIICGGGAGACMAANRFPHIRATVCHNPSDARETREHNDANVICIGADHIDLEVAFLTVQSFLESPFDAAERRIRRIEMIS